MAGFASIIQCREGDRDRPVNGELPALLPCLGEGGFVELLADGPERLIIHPRDPGLDAACLLALRLDARDELGSRPDRSQGGDCTSGTAQAYRDFADVAEVTLDAEAL